MFDVNRITWYFNYYFNIAQAWAYTIVGIFTLIIAITFTVMYMYTEYNKFKHHSKKKDINE